MDTIRQKLIADRLGIAIEAVLYGLLTFMPLAFGVVHAWSEEVVILTAAVLLILSVIQRIMSQERMVGSWAVLPVVMLLLVVVFQLVPLPNNVVKAIAPNTHLIKTELLSQLTTSSKQTEDPSGLVEMDDEGAKNALKTRNATFQKMELTFYPSATWRGLRLMIAIASIFWVTLQYYTTPERIKRLLTCIAAVGGAIALLAILQVTSGTDKIYWTVPIVHESADAGSFVNHSNFAQFMNASIGAALALVLVKFHEFFTGRSIPAQSIDSKVLLTDTRHHGYDHGIDYHNPVNFATDIANYLTCPAGRWFWWMLMIIVLSMTSIFISLSRGGMVTMLIAASFTALLLTTRGSVKGRGWIMAIMALGSFICVLWIGFDAVYERLATLSDLQQAQSGRWQIVKDIALAWTRFPVFGTGLGTHPFVYSMFDRSSVPFTFGNAENEYAQGLEELGLAGFIPLLVFGIFICVAYVRCIRSSAMPVRSAAYGLGFGLLAVLLHSFSDFGQHLPANAVLTAIFSALLISLAKTQPRMYENAHEPVFTNNLQSAPSSTLKPLSVKPIQRYTTPSACGLLAVILLYTVFVPVGADDARIAEKHWASAQRSASHLESIDWVGSNAQYADLLRNASQAADLQPNNVEYRHWLNVWRWRSMSRITDVAGNVVLPPQAMPHVQRLVGEFADAIRICPTYGQSWTMAGQLQYFILDQKNDGSHLIRTGAKLAPCDATACFVAGLLEVTEFNQLLQSAQSLLSNNSSQEVPASRTEDQTGVQELASKTGMAAGLAVSGTETDLNSSVPSVPSVTNNSVQSVVTEPSFHWFARAVELDGRFFEDVAAVYLSLNRPDLAVDLAADDIGHLNRVATLLADSKTHSDLADAARQKVFDLLREKADDPDVSPATLASLASMYAKEDQLDAAVDFYQRALVADYGNIGWRMALARLLGESDDTDAAIKECRIVLRLKPGYSQAIRLIEKLSTESTASQQ